MLSIAAGAAVAAKAKYRVNQGSWSVGTEGLALLELHGKRAWLPVLGRRSAASNLWRSSLSSLKPACWAALRRQAVPALKARGQSRRGTCGSSSGLAPKQLRLEPPTHGLATAWYRLCPPPKVLANPSLEPGPPPASHLARAASSVIIRRAGQAPSRFRPLSSNVRPQKPPTCRSSAA